MTENSAPLSAKEQALIAVILLSITIMIGVDIVSDAREGARVSHMAVEAVIGVFAAFGYVFVTVKSMKSKKDLQTAKESLSQSRQEARYWRQNSKRFADGLSQAIDDQFQKWIFSPTEKEVALLILKGLSSKEIAEVRGVADKTVRAQATAIYEKSGLSGRAELSAFFLEDLLAPKVESRNE